MSEYVNSLTKEEMDVLGEIGNISLGNAATTLSVMVNQRVEITTPVVEVINRSEALDDYDKRWIQANTKECPNCHQKIQKSQGCNYMYCDPKAGGCGKAFCYVCETDWAKHSQDHFNCNKYTEEIKRKEREAKKIQQDLDYEIKKFER